jgi:hypothetical protein
MRQSIPCHTTVDAVGFAKLFLRELIRLHGLRKTVVSDRGPQLASTFVARFVAGWEWINACLRHYIHELIARPNERILGWNCTFWSL